MGADLSARAADVRELMDDPDADPQTLERTYRRFGAVNAVVSRPGALYRADVRPRARRRRSAAGAPLRILDVGAGGGDLCRALAARLRRDRLDAGITALDIDPRAVAWARAHDGGAGVAYRCASAADLAERGERFDIVLSNHVLHHLDDEGLAEMLATTRALVAPHGLVAHHDIARSRFGYVAFAAGTWPFARTLLSGSFIREDGLTSIRRSYTVTELAMIAPPGWVVRGGFPSRLQLRWEQDDGAS
ncbi:2-polyprenyl-3-methyl-5-hydroxy-6-metoxy-1, 4-benzoquinol methylase [Microbacterium sp. 8M]|uniref:methyltransferase domain-containing protein n=1 Tax=Microbacterium sp. 8M TaxID=2653153 RepID=UPI0012F11C3C|nr:methyltransferase domain-containing protein [Microbacterium sp. 8M]VXC11466.1 2-polyprenyl-3-methyl-5-hydroxy-6-metoxy-1, 4-benzoquinol methylase [Microbacterium sp. 8M]